MCKVIMILYIYALCRVDLCTYLHVNSVHFSTRKTLVKERSCVSLPRADGIKKINEFILFSARLKLNLSDDEV